VWLIEFIDLMLAGISSGSCMVSQEKMSSHL